MALPTIPDGLKNQMFDNIGDSWLLDNDMNLRNVADLLSGEDSTGGGISQRVVLASNNCSTTNLGATGTFTGTADDTTGVAGIQVNLATTTDCLVYVDQSMDGTNWDITDSYEYFYIYGGNSWTVQATATHVRVRVTNLDPIATSYFRLQTSLCPVVEALPRSLDDRGNLKVAVKGMEGYLGTEVEVTPMGEMKVQVPTRTVGSIFTGSALDTNFWTVSNSTTASGTVTVSAGTVTLSSGEAATGSVTLSSVRRGRYVAGVANVYRAQVSNTTCVGVVTKRWGSYDSNDGYFFEHNGTTLSVVARKGGADNKISSGSFNGEHGNTYVIGTNFATFEIYWTNKSVWFVVDDEVIHKFTATTSSLVSTPILPVAAEVLNGAANTSANTLVILVQSISRLGPEKTTPIYKNITSATTTVCKLSAGTLHRIIVNKPVNSTITIYDNTSAVAANKVATVTFTAAQTEPTTLTYDVPFFNGLTIVTGGAFDLSVIYE